MRRWGNLSKILECLCPRPCRTKILRAIFLTKKVMKMPRNVTVGLIFFEYNNKWCKFSQFPGGGFGKFTDRDQRSWLFLTDPKKHFPQNSKPKKIPEIILWNNIYIYRLDSWKIILFMNSIFNLVLVLSPGIDLSRIPYWNWDQGWFPFSVHLTKASKLWIDVFNPKSCVVLGSNYLWQ